MALVWKEDEDHDEIVSPFLIFCPAKVIMKLDDFKTEFTAL